MASTSAPLIYGTAFADARERWPSRNLLLDELAAYGPVIFLETRKDSSSPFAQPRIERVRENLFVMRGAVGRRLPRGNRATEPVIARLDALRISRELKRQGWPDAVLWLTVADPRLRARFPHARLVYDCMDPAFEPGQQTRHDRQLGRLVRRAELVFASAQALREDVVRLGGRDVAMLPNAADPGALLGDPHRAQAWRQRLVDDESRPVIGYLGTMDWRFDHHFVMRLAQSNPEAVIVLAGRLNQDRKADLGPLLALPNVVSTGQLGYDDGYAVASIFDLGLVPFFTGPVNDRVNSVKTFMYLQFGVPVLSTEVAESVANPYVVTARGDEDLGAIIATMLATTGGAFATERQAFASTNTWQDRAAEAHTALADRGIWGTV